jgi:hypothetical protein
VRGGRRNYCQPANQLIVSLVGYLVTGIEMMDVKKEQSCRVVNKFSVTQRIPHASYVVQCSSESSHISKCMPYVILEIQFSQLQDITLLQDQDVLHSWLMDLHFEEYFPLFASAGYDMPTICRMTPEVSKQS